MRVQVVCVCVGGLVGCHAGTGQSPDGGMPEGDGPAAQGLHVDWISKPDLPGPIGNNVTIDSVTLQVQNLRAIADAGPTDSSSATVTWDSGTMPGPTELETAPTGLYSKLSLDLDGDLLDNSYEIKGSVMISGQPHAFEIHDRDISKITMDCNLTLAPDGGLTLPIRIDFAGALGVIDFSTLDTEGSMLELDTDDAQMPAFRAQLVKSFKLEDGD